MLKPGGLFYGSTFFIKSPLVNNPKRAEDYTSEELEKIRSLIFFNSVEEVQAYFTYVGFAGVTGASVVRQEGQQCAIIKACKAPVSDELYETVFRRTE